MAKQLVLGLTSNQVSFPPKINDPLLLKFLFRYLPPYSPDLNPIEQLFSKIKSMVRIEGKRTLETLWSSLGKIMNKIEPSGYKLVDQSGFRWDAEIKEHIKLTDLLRIEVAKLFRTVPMLTELANHSLDATALGNLLNSHGDARKSDDIPN